MLDLGIDAALLAERERLNGPAGSAFLQRLPALVERWQRELGLEGARIMPGGVLSGVFACRSVSDGTPLVLKLSTDLCGAAAEAAALRAWAGRGACALRFVSDDASAMLLERVLPGEPARPGNERADIEQAARLLATLHLAAAPAGRVPETSDRLPATSGRIPETSGRIPETSGRIPETSGRIPDASAELRWRFERAHTLLEGPSHAHGVISHAQIERAFEAALALCSSTHARVLLHGDFLAKNLLLGPGGRWRAIDPRPCIGDPCMDAAFWALAYLPGVAVRERCARLAQAAGLERGRVSAWAAAFAVSEAVLVRGAERAVAHAAVARAAGMLSS